MAAVKLEVTTTEQGVPVVRKRATTGDGEARLAHEARVLAHARHPGVVDLLDVASGAAGPVVTTRWAGSHTLATLSPPLPEQAAGLAAALATVVADLHDVGVVHGRIRPEHVIVGAGGRPVLCGFGEASMPGSTTRHHAADDVAGLGAVLHHLVAGDVEAEPIPDRRRWSLRRRRWTGFQRRGLMTLADQAGAEDPRARPTARALAAAVLVAVPGARLPSPAPPADADTPARPRSIAPGSEPAVRRADGELPRRRSRLAEIARRTEPPAPAALRSSEPPPTTTDTTAPTAAATNTSPSPVAPPPAGPAPTAETAPSAGPSRAEGSPVATPRLRRGRGRRPGPSTVPPASTSGAGAGHQRVLRVPSRSASRARPHRTSTVLRRARVGPASLASTRSQPRVQHRRRHRPGWPALAVSAVVLIVFAALLIDRLVSPTAHERSTERAGDVGDPNQRAPAPNSSPSLDDRSARPDALDPPDDPTADAVAPPTPAPPDTTGGPERPSDPTGRAGPPTGPEPDPSVAPDVLDPPDERSRCPVADQPSADVDGDGCPEPVALDGAVLVAGRTRLGVGRAGDLVGLGDWDCDGEVTAALARPSTGEVFVFDAWARPDEPVTVEATAVVARPRTLATAPADDGCDDLAVTDSAGRRHLIDLEEAR